MTAFADRLDGLVAARESQIVLGLDPDPARLWPEALAAAPADGSPALRAAAAVRAHCAALIDAAGPACVAVKPQLACFERLGADGWAALAATVEHAQAAGLLVIADAKRGDIDVSAAAYAQALVGGTPTPFGEVRGLGADAFTANPLLGVDALAPFVDAARAAERRDLRARADLQPGRGRRRGPARGRRRARVWERLAAIVDAARRRGGTGAVGHRRRRRRHRARAPRADARADAARAVPAAGHRRAGRARRGSRPGLRRRAAPAA